MKKRISAVLLAAMTACSAFTTVVSAGGYSYSHFETERNGSFYARKYEENPDDATFSFSHPVYNENTGGFSCEWDSVFHIAAEVGWNLPAAYAGKSYKALPGLSVTYDADFRIDGNGYYGVHGWTKNPLSEFYIVEGWGSWRPPGGGYKGTVTVNGRKYDLYSVLYHDAPSIEGTKTIPAYYCVRQENSVTEGVQSHVTGTIDVYEVFQEWANAGWNVNGELEYCGLFAEGYGGGQHNSSGSFHVHSASRSWEDPAGDLTAPDWFLTDKPAGVPGDANCDGVVDVADAVLVMRYAAADSEAVITEQGVRNADTDQNGNTDSDDAVNILLYIAKKIRLPLNENGNDTAAGI
ncbi:MAG: glycoside hydrolase family 11 protein [Oscillospiraceae bacterium]|nr:glycoside hydrolase family 11 protein [Oscillospiraceae bacterium]